MSLDDIFNPESIAVVGATPKSGSFGNRIIKRIIDFGFPGKIYPINPNYDKIVGIETYPEITEVPSNIDTAVVIVPARRTPEVVRGCVAKGVKGIIIMAGGFSEVGNPELEQEILEIIEGTQTHIVGPNCMGIYNPSAGITYHDRFPKEGGNVAFISQSGGIGAIFTILSSQRGVRISKLVSSGNESDLQFTDYLEYFADDPDTEVIAGYVEQIRDSKRFLKVAKEVIPKKPIILWKVGRGKAGRRATKSHTGALAGSDEVYEGVLKQAGVIKARNLDELINYVLLFKCLKESNVEKMERIGVITGTGGLGIMITDGLESENFELPEFSEETQKKLREFVPRYAQTVNPADLTAAAGSNPSLIGESVDILQEENIDAIVIGDTDLDFRNQYEDKVGSGGKPILTVSPFLPEEEEKIFSLAQKGIPSYPTAKELAKSLSAFRWYLREISLKNCD